MKIPAKFVDFWAVMSQIRCNYFLFNFIIDFTEQSSVLTKFSVLTNLLNIEWQYGVPRSNNSIASLGFVYIWFFGANVVPFTSEVVSLIFSSWSQHYLNPNFIKRIPVVDLAKVMGFSGSPSWEKLAR